MKEIKIIGDEIYYYNTLVAKLVESPMHTVQGEFVDEINSLKDEDTYEKKYEKLTDALVGYGDLDYAENLLAQIKRTPNNKQTLNDIENALSNIRNGLDYMYEQAYA